MKDALGRKIDYLRISVTDRCNLRCVYCMPANGVKPVRHEEVLRLEEIERVCRCAARLGVRHVKLTGGEPLVRRGVPGLVRRIKALPGIEEVTLTSNGILLAEQLDELADAGLDAVNISLDTLDKAHYEATTRGTGLEKALKAIDGALERGIRVKVNCVPVRELGGNDFIRLAELARERAVDVRFIELMPIGCGKNLTPVPMDEVRTALEQAFGPLSASTQRHGNGPASYARAQGFRGGFGFIGALSGCFCEECNRIRLTSTGFLKLCLHHNAGVDLRPLLRGGADDTALEQAIQSAVWHKPERQCFGEAVDDEEIRGMSQIGG